MSLGTGESFIRRWFNQLTEDRDGVTPKGKTLTRTSLEQEKDILKKLPLS